MFVFREEYYVEREKPSDDRLDEMAAWQERMERLHGKAEVIIGKQRHGPDRHRGNSPSRAALPASATSSKHGKQGDDQSF